jgi:hypothetical protein
MVFEEKSVTVDTEVDAKKAVCQREEAYALVKNADKVVVASGQKTLEYEPKTVDKDELLSKITGRTGNLRAPALKIGNVYYIGFNSGMYEKTFS